MISKNQKQAILEYGEAKYITGYKDGYTSGIISGVLLTTIAILVYNISKN